MKLIRLMKGWMMELMGLPTCEEIEGFAYAYLENELESSLASKFERHLRTCVNCDHFIQTYREVARPEDRLAQKIPLDKEFEQRVAEFLSNNT